MTGCNGYSIKKIAGGYSAAATVVKVNSPFA